MPGICQRYLLLPAVVALLAASVALGNYNQAVLDFDRPTSMPNIQTLEVMCGKDHMTVKLEFDRQYNGVVFSKGQYGHDKCVYVHPYSGGAKYNFQIAYKECGTKPDLNGKYYENTVVVQYDPELIEVWDEAKRLRCEWFNDYEKTATKPPMVIADLDVIELDFQGDNVDCWMEIQDGKGPWAPPLTGIVPLGSTLTMVVGINDNSGEFDMRVKSCEASNGKEIVLQITDEFGCVLRPKMFSKFTKIRGTDQKSSLLTYAYFHAFKFPDAMTVHLRCQIEICRYGCPGHCEREPVGYSHSKRQQGEEPLVRGDDTRGDQHSPIPHLHETNHIDEELHEYPPQENANNPIGYGVRSPLYQGASSSPIEAHHIFHELNLNPVAYSSTPQTVSRHANEIDEDAVRISETYRPSTPLPQHHAPEPISHLQGEGFILNHVQHQNNQPHQLQNALPQFPVPPPTSEEQVATYIAYQQPPQDFHITQLTEIHHSPLVAIQDHNGQFQLPPGSLPEVISVPNLVSEVPDIQVTPTHFSEQSIRIPSTIESMRNKINNEPLIFGDSPIKPNPQSTYSQRSDKGSFEFPHGPRSLRRRRQVVLDKITSSTDVGIFAEYEVVSGADLAFSTNGTSKKIPVTIFSGKMPQDIVYGLCLSTSSFSALFVLLAMCTTISVLVAGFMCYHRELRERKEGLEDPPLEFQIKDLSVANILRAKHS